MIAVGLASAVAVSRFAPHGEFFAGMVVGGVWSLIVWLWDDPPEHVGRWRRGADGERQTWKVLRALDASRWRSFHDRDGGRGNLDHIVVGPGGVFLLDSKNLGGTVSVELNGLTIKHPTAATPRSDYTFTTLEPSMRGAAARLKERIEEQTGLRPWVQAVVVIWGDFPAGEAEGDRITYIAGERLAAWLEKQPPKLAPRAQSLLQLALDAELVAPPAAAIA